MWCRRRSRRPCSPPRSAISAIRIWRRPAPSASNRTPRTEAEGPPSLRADVGGLDDPPPLVELGVQECGELLGRRALDHHAARLELLLHRRLRQRLDGVGLDLRNHVARALAGTRNA